MMYTHSDAQRVASEDGDAAPAIEVAATDKGRPAACMLADEAHGLLWVADREGWVYGERGKGQGACAESEGARA